MSKRPAGTCAECGAALDDQNDRRGRGRAGVYCSTACRMRAYRRRKGHAA